MECTYPKHFPSILVGFPQPPWFPSTIRNMLDTFQLFLFCWINVTLTIFWVYNSKIYSKTAVSSVDTDVFRISTAQVFKIDHFDIFHSVFAWNSALAFIHLIWYGHSSVCLLTSLRLRQAQLPYDLILLLDPRLRYSRGAPNQTINKCCQGNRLTTGDKHRILHVCVW